MTLNVAGHALFPRSQKTLTYYHLESEVKSFANAVHLMLRWSSYSLWRVSVTQFQQMTVVKILLPQHLGYVIKKDAILSADFLEEKPGLWDSERVERFPSISIMEASAGSATSPNNLATSHLEKPPITIPFLETSRPPGSAALRR